VGALVAKRAKAYLAIPVDMRRTTPRIFLNKVLADAVARRDLQGLIMGLLRAALIGATTPGAVMEFERPADTKNPGGEPAGVSNSDLT